MATGPQNREMILITKQLVGSAFQMCKVVGISPDAAQNAQHKLDKDRPLDQTPVDKMGKGIKMADVIAFKLEPRAVGFAQIGQNGLCLLYTSDAADDSLRVDLGGRRIIKKRLSQVSLRP